MSKKTEKEEKNLKLKSKQNNYTESHKTPPIFLNNSVKNRLILIIFRAQNSEEI